MHIIVSQHTNACAQNFINNYLSTQMSIMDVPLLEIVINLFLSQKFAKDLTEE